MSIQTVGVEEEFHIVDRRTRRLSPAATELLAELPAAVFTREAKETCIETNSRPHANLSDLHADLVASRTLLADAAERAGVAVIASGTAPIAHLDDAPQSAGERYVAIARDYARVAREQVICGLHVHVQVDDRDIAARAMAWISPHLPTLLALSASSPYWLGQDTGYASWRNMVWQRWPSAGPATGFRSAREYDALVEGLVRSGVITDTGMYYQDLRLSAHAPTIEMRICDACPDVNTSVLIAAVFRALVHRGVAAAANDRTMPSCPEVWLRAATWRAARSGLDGLLVDPTTMTAESARTTVWRLVEDLAPELSAAGDLAFVRQATADLLAQGGGAHDIRRSAADPRHAVDLLISRTRTFRPVGSDAPTTGGRDPAAVTPRHLLQPPLVG
ncbi:carboxylate-amine ligase [Embleya hyalina]|uniref:Putative glutamate--cysteine ligase 2 n=1 Tax=Embleya hyalina TaxID=516124 RepID=A0A401YQR4_9ACTN|nr:glutamate--cysteine ligase [Embleya hyalina]GCD96946.1 putative glutamate--cysteine ligase 2-2 [Embleya hyalina]